jgi:formate hydrogenlyase transcriptional activator
LSLDEVRADDFRERVFHPEDVQRLREARQKGLSGTVPFENEQRALDKNGKYRWFLIRYNPLLDERGNVLRWYATGTDIQDRKQTETLLAAEKRTLEMIADGASLKDVLNHLCASIDVQVAPSVTIATILLASADGKRLYPGGGPRVPDEWRSTVFPVPVAFDSFCCGTAAFLKQRLIVPDVATEVNWPDKYRDLAIRNGIRAAWSEPILTKDNDVLGTFALYSHEARVPTEEDLALIKGAGHIARIAIERQRSQEALRQEEHELRQLIDFLPQQVLVLDKDGVLLQANKTMLDYKGVTLEEMKGGGTRERINRDVHPDDLERVQSERSEGLSRGKPFEMEKRLLNKDGQFRWFLFRYNPVLNEAGEIVRWFATATDIEDRKQTEDRMRNEAVALREDIVRSSMFEQIVGSSQALRDIQAQISRVAPADSTVLIQGETGTGKELIARAIHSRSKRANRAFIRVNCAAIPPSLVASELFGHEKGAFTGALQRRLGRFESADGGTIFLDEVAELPHETQVSLLRVLQEREFERVGGNQPIHVDVRVLAATNRDLNAAVDEGGFRKDLFYRLNVFPIQVPPLRDRADDIPLLVEYLVDRYAKKAGKRIRSISKQTLQLFQSYSWPGNVRELQNVIERAVILCDGETLSVDSSWLVQPAPITKASLSLAANLAEDEKAMIENALRETNGVVSGPAGAATKLGIPRQTLETKIRKLRINRYSFKTA